MKSGRKEKIQAVLPGACTCMSLTSKNKNRYWFRTCDIEIDIFKEGAHVVQHTAGKEIQYHTGRVEISKYQFHGITYNCKDTWLLDGVNECGLIGGLLMLYEGTSVNKTVSDKEGYVGMEFVTKVLSTCKNIQEVCALASKTQILNIPYGSITVPATMHYFFIDTIGEEVVLEATDVNNPGIFRIYTTNENVGVMTNSPSYDQQLQNLAWFLSQSQEMKQGFEGQAIRELHLDGRKIRADERASHISLNGTFPGSYSSYDRFIRIAVLKALNNSGNEFDDEKMLALGSNIMNAVWEPPNKGMFHYTKKYQNGEVEGQKDSSTQYMVMYDCEKRCFHMKAFDMSSWIKYELYNIGN